jgi:hypothetical protein
VDGFGTAAVTSLTEHLSGLPAGTVSLRLPRGSQVTSRPAALQRVGPFAGTSGAPTTKVFVTTEAIRAAGAPPAAVAAVQFTHRAPRAPLRLSFTTSSLPLLDTLFRDQGAGVSIPVLRLAVRTGAARPALDYTCSALRVGSFGENNLSGSLSRTAALVIPRP